MYYSFRPMDTKTQQHSTPTSTHYIILSLLLMLTQNILHNGSSLKTWLGKLIFFLCGKFYCFSWLFRLLSAKPKKETFQILPKAGKEQIIDDKIYSGIKYCECKRNVI